MRSEQVQSGPEEGVSESVVRVRYAETDAMGIVHHSQYVIWFEVGRSNFMRATGFTYADVERAGFFFRIAEIGARYLAPAFYDELIVIRTWLSRLESRAITFSYAVVRPADEAGDQAEATLVTGFTRLICTDAQGRVRRLPERIRGLLAPMLRGE